MDINDIVNFERWQCSIFSIYFYHKYYNSTIWRVISYKITARVTSKIASSTITLLTTTLGSTFKNRLK